MGLWDKVCVTWAWVWNNWDCILFAFFCVYTVVLPCIAKCSAWMNPLVETPIAQPDIDCTIVCTCTTAVCTNCTTVCNRVYNNGFCRPVDLLHIARNESTEIVFLSTHFNVTTYVLLSTHFNVTTYEAIPTHVPWNASDYATVVFVIAVLIVVIVIIQKGIKHWDSIVLYCKPYCTVEYAKNMTLCVTCLATILLSEPRLLEPRKWLRESGAV